MDMTDKIKKTEVLEKHIIGENGISYTLGEDGLYYPDIRLPEGTHYEIGRYGRMRGEPEDVKKIIEAADRDDYPAIVVGEHHLAIHHYTDEVYEIFAKGLGGFY